MRIYRSTILEGKPLTVSQDVDLESLPASAYSYPLACIKNARIDGAFYREGDSVYFDGTIDGTLALHDARTNELFDQECHVDRVVYLLDDEQKEDADGYVFPGNRFELLDFVACVLKSETPIKPLKGDSPLPESDDVLSFHFED